MYVFMPVEKKVVLTDRRYLDGECMEYLRLLGYSNPKNFKTIYIPPERIYKLLDTLRPLRKEGLKYAACTDAHIQFYRRLKPIFFQASPKFWETYYIQ